MEHVEAPVEVVPLLVDCESELLEKLADVSTGLQSDNWNARREALKRLRELAIGGAWQWDCFISHVKGVHEYIGQAILDLRSLPAQEACNTVSVLAQVIKPEFYMTLS